MTNYLRKILITGGNGQLANALRAQNIDDTFQLFICNKQELDITDMLSIDAAFVKYSPDIIVNAAAYTAVDQAEIDADQALLVNEIGAKNIAIACEKNKIPLIHFGTDYIFDGKKTSPYHENDTANPLNIYGKSKYLGEEMIRKYCEKHIILRVSSVFSEYGHNFFKTISKLACEQKVLKVVKNQIITPTYAGHISDVTYSLIKNFSRNGTYHYCDTPSVSWYEFAVAIIEKAKQHPSFLVEKILPVTEMEYKRRAVRPAYSVLACDKLERDYGIKQADWMSGLNKNRP